MNTLTTKQALGLRMLRDASQRLAVPVEKRTSSVLDVVLPRKKQRLIPKKKAPKVTLAKRANKPQRKRLYPIGDTVYTSLPDIDVAVPIKPLIDDASTASDSDTTPRRTTGGLTITLDIVPELSDKLSEHDSDGESESSSESSSSSSDSTQPQAASTSSDSSSDAGEYIDCIHRVGRDSKPRVCANCAQ
jgi:hypothetical protein